MAISAKVLIGCTTSVAGVSSAVIVPLTTMNSQNNSISSKIENKIPNIELTLCKQEESEKFQEVSYRSKNVKNICGNLQKDQNENLEQISEVYTDLIKDTGNKGDINEEGGELKLSDKGTVQCQNGSDHQTSGIVPNSENGVKYLGLCEKPKLIGETKFIKGDNKQVTEEKADSVKLGICKNDCWSSDRQTENGSNGKQVMFYDKESSKDEQVKEMKTD